MTCFKKSLSIFLSALMLAATIGLTSCSGVSEEEMAELEALRSEVNELSQEVNLLKSEKTKIEREIAEKNAKLDQCAKEIEQTKVNLETIGSKAK